MSDRERRLEAGEHGLTQHLLRAALAEVAPDTVRANVLDAVNAALPELPTGASPTHTEGGAARVPDAGVSSGMLARGVVASAVAHPVAATTLVALVVTLAAVAHHATRAAPKSEPAPAATAAALAPRDELEPPGLVPNTSRVSPRLTEPPTQSAPASTPKRRQIAHRRPIHPTPPLAEAGTELTPRLPPPRDHLGEQLTLLSRARQHLRTGEPDAALTVLASFERQFPEGALLPEVTVLRRRAQHQMAQKPRPARGRAPD